MRESQLVERAMDLLEAHQPVQIDSDCILLQTFPDFCLQCSWDTSKKGFSVKKQKKKNPCTYILGSDCCSMQYNSHFLHLSPHKNFQYALSEVGSFQTRVNFASAPMLLSPVVIVPTPLFHTDETEEPPTFVGCYSLFSER